MRWGIAMREVRFGIIGCGAVGQSMGGADVYNGIGEWHAKFINERPDARVVACADISEQNARAFAAKFGLDRIHTDHRELLAREDVDAVTICTPSGTHGAIAIAAAGAGKHALSEKPLETTIEKAEAAIAAHERAGTRLSVVFQNRFSRATQAIKKALADGTFGRPLIANAMCRRYRTEEYYARSGWRGTWAMDGGGACMNQGIHMIDTFIYLLGEPRSVYARTGTLGHAIEVEDGAAAVVAFASGCIGVIECTTCAYPDFGDSIVIHGERGSVEVEGLPATVKRWEPMDESQRRSLDEFVEPGHEEYRLHRHVYDDFVDAILNDRPPSVDGREGLRSLRLIHAVYESGRTGKPLEL
jgi:predicted dehydrogenase